MEKILTPEHEQKLVEIGAMIRAAEMELGSPGKRGWKSAACRLAIDYLYAELKAGASVPHIINNLNWLEMEIAKRDD